MAMSRLQSSCTPSRAQYLVCIDFLPMETKARGGERRMLRSDIALCHSRRTGKHSCSPSYIFKCLNSFKLLNKASKYVKKQALYCSGTSFSISKTEITILFSHKEKYINNFAELRSHTNTNQEARNSQSMQG